MPVYDPLQAPLEMLLRAAEDKWGCIVVTDQVDLLKARLYKAKAKYSAQFPQLLDLSIRTSAEDPTSQVWIAKSNIAKVLNGEDSSKGHPQLSPGREGDIQVHDHPAEEAGGGTGHALPQAALPKPEQGD